MIAATPVMSGALIAATPAVKTDPPNGRWVIRLAQPAETGAAKPVVHVSLRTPGLNTLYVPFEKFSGLTVEVFTSSAEKVRFDLHEDAGTLRFDGTFSGGRGTGRFDFVPSRAFADELERRGMERPTLDQQFEMARHEIGYDLLQALAANGYAQPTTRALISAGINGVDTEYVNEMSALGYPMTTIGALIRLRVNGVDPQFMRQTNARAGRKLPVETILNLRVNSEH
jgi:hypothetical protein